MSDTVAVYTRYPPGAAECIDLGFLEELGCWGPYDGDDPGFLPNVTDR